MHYDVQTFIKTVYVHVYAKQNKIPNLSKIINTFLLH